MIGKRFRLARNQKGLSLREIGEAVGVSPQAVAQWERSNPKFGIGKTHTIANLLGVDAEWLDGVLGTDEDIRISNRREFFSGKIPIIHINHAILFARFSNTSVKDIEYIRTIEPTGNISGHGFAIILQEGSEFMSLHRGDILIFDNAVRPRTGDIVIGIEIYENFIRSSISGYLGESDSKDGVPLLIGDTQASGEEYRVNSGSANPIAVMVEKRTLRES